MFNTTYVILSCVFLSFFYELNGDNNIIGNKYIVIYSFFFFFYECTWLPTDFMFMNIDIIIYLFTYFVTYYVLLNTILFTSHNTILHNYRASIYKLKICTRRKCVKRVGIRNIHLYRITICRCNIKNNFWCRYIYNR